MMSDPRYMMDIIV